ncbi:hypothetical protein B2G88_13185 [Natronolimnobius baerhuensis]|uniref:Uncharacterized protein n=2 Tax=Natronolimnobius baerhuensis TaxID=253108 RepID=A0A202E6W4_9EURY|nr:hypothetical protein B2G88_13185 [Natronolimnobius baerhuensis]
MGDGPLDLPSAAVGVYAGLLGYGVGAALGVPRSALIVGALFGWLVVALGLSQRPWVWMALGRRRLLAAPMVVALVPALVLAVGLEYEAVAVPLTPVLWLVGLALSGMVVLEAGTTRYADRAAGEQLISWTATADPATQRRKTVSIVLGAAGFVGTFVAMLLFQIPSFLLTVSVVIVVVLAVRRGRPQTYEACEHGLRYRDVGTAGAQFCPWTRFDDYRETDDAIVLERRFGVDVRMDADAVPAEAREMLAASIDNVL